MGNVSLNRPGSWKGALFFLLCLLCLVFSLTIHLAFLQKAKTWMIGGFSPESYDSIVPRTFRMKRVEIDTTTLEEEKKKVVETRQEIPVTVENDHPQIDHAGVVMDSKNLLSKPMESLPPEKPEAQVKASGLANLFQKADAVFQKELAVDLPPVISEVKFPEPQESLDPKQGSGSGKGIASQKFSSLDDLLATSDVVKKNTAPILMPTDLLFEYDSETLKPEAADTLTKLGSLIKKNAQASFRIEGHTDSFGSDDYNNALSLRRAEAVKNWLRMNMGLDASRISTLGLGKSRLLVPATGSVDQQQLNRRVEIIISTAK